MTWDSPVLQFAKAPGQIAQHFRNPKKLLAARPRSGGHWFMEAGCICGLEPAAKMCWLHGAFHTPPPFSRLLSNPQAISFTVFSCSGVGVYLQIRASSPILTRAKTPLPGSQCIDTYPLSNSKPSSRRAD